MPLIIIIAIRLIGRARSLSLSLAEKKNTERLSFLNNIFEFYSQFIFL